MTPTGGDLRRLTALADELRSELLAATTAGDVARADQLRCELALLDDLALPEAVNELRLQRLTYRAAAEAISRRVPATLVDFLA